MKSFVAILAILASPLVSADSGGWTRIDSPHFEMYTTLPGQQARNALETFERARGIFLNIKALHAPPQLPVIIVAFSSAGEYRPYSPKDFAPAYSTADEQRDYIVMGDLGADQTRAAVHEYVHVLVRNSGLSIPLWLNEGLAEVYSGMEIRDSKVVIGAIAPDRIRIMGSSDLMHLPVLFKVGVESPAYNERTHAGVFYAESCLLVHMLMLSDGYAKKFPEFLARVSAADSSETALADVYEKTTAEVERDMAAYFRQSMAGGAVYSAPAETSMEMGSRPATDFETAMTLAKLTAMLGRFDEAGRSLDRLAAAHPDNTDVEMARAYIAWRKGDREAAAESLGHVVDQPGADWKTCWDYARLLEITRPQPQREIAVLRKALEMKPDLPEARFMLGRELYLTRQRDEALSELEQITDPAPGYAGQMFLLMAHAAFELDDRPAARHYSSEARKYPLSTEELQMLDALAKRLNAPTMTDDDEDAKRPTIRRGKPKPKSTAP